MDPGGRNMKGFLLVKARFLLLFLLQRNSVFVLSINDDFPR